MMEKITIDDIKKLYLPPRGSHKGENGKLTIIGGSHLFHGASLWALKIASRIVDMVFYASIPENNELTQQLKSEIYDFIAVPRDEVENYIKESDVVLIGPGMVRIPSTSEESWCALRACLPPSEVSLDRILSLKDEGKQTYWLTKYLLAKYPDKKWIIDAGSLQMMEPEWLNKNCLITPHKKEFEKLFKIYSTSKESGSPIPSPSEESLPPAPRLRRAGRATSEVFPWLVSVKEKAQKYGCTILLKSETDIICSPKECKFVEGGNAGMTKGGTGDVLAGLAAALACKNDLFLAACTASYINKRAGEELFKKVGHYFNASDLADQIPQTIKQLLI